MTDRRITRSVSTEQQMRLAAQPQLSNPHPNTYHSHHNGCIKGLSGLINEAENSMKDSHFAVLRNTTEEMLIKSLVEGIPAPSMEGIGLVNLPQAIRVDSEELFHSWVSLGEGQNAGQLQGHHRPRQSTRRRSNELALLLSQQNNESFNRADSFDQFLQTNDFFLEEADGENKARNTEGEGACAIEPSPLKWFSQTRPITRSRSSELRRRYAAMQGGSPLLTDHDMKQTTITDSLPNRRFHQLPFPPQVHQSSLAPLYGPLGGESVSSFVTLLKGTLERKRMGKGIQQLQQQQQRWPQSVPASFYPQKLNENLQNRVEGSPHTVSSPSQQGGLGLLRHEGYDQVQNSRQTLIEGQVPHIGAASMANNQNQPGLLSHAPSPSESSVGAPVLSAGEDPCTSGQATSLKQHPKRQKRNNPHPDTDTGEAIKDIPRRDQNKTSQLSRLGSVTSSSGLGNALVKEDPTKKRRVERQRKMAEAKGRSAVPMMPSDLRATLTRCDTLEKEVRSLKLNLSFMNRKDSEQTKQIEELQKQNEELQEEKEKLLEEIEQLTSRAHMA